VTAKEYLMQVKVIKRRIEVINGKVQELRSALEYCPPNMEGGSSGSSDDRMSKNISKIIEYERKSYDTVNTLIERRLEIEDTINAITDPLQREILERRYLLNEPWEGRFDKITGKYTPGIPETMNYSPSWIFQQHGIALQKIQKSIVKCSEIEF
jgi:hypothetical protein